MSLPVAGAWLNVSCTWMSPLIKCTWSLVIHGAISWRPNHEPRFCRPFRCSFQVQQSIAALKLRMGGKRNGSRMDTKKLSSNPEPERDAQAGPALFESWVNFDDFIM